MHACNIADSYKTMLTLLHIVLRTYFSFIFACALNLSPVIQGDTKGGFSIFYPDEGLDTGDVLLMR